MGVVSFPESFKTGLIIHRGNFMFKFYPSRIPSVLIRQVLSAGIVVAGAFSTSASAVVDYTAAALSATTEVNSAIAAAIPVGIVVLAAVIGWRLFKRFARG